MMVSALPRTPGWPEAMGIPFMTILPVKGSDPLQKNPAGIDSLEKSANDMPFPGVCQRSTPLAIERSTAKVGTASRTAKATIMNTESFFISFLLSIRDLVWIGEKALGPAYAAGGPR